MKVMGNPIFLKEKPKEIPPSAPKERPIKVILPKVNNPEIMPLDKLFDIINSKALSQKFY
jgi:hypothetical protein